MVIRVYLIFPFLCLSEQKSRPEVTAIIAASSGSMKTEEVARRAMEGIKAGKFTVSCNFEGFLLSLATTGMSPQRSFWLAFLEVITAGPIRLVALFFQWDWYNAIEKWSKTKNK